MSDQGTQLALREWRQHLLHPLTLIALAAVSAVLALVGPFGTIDSLSFSLRSLYWTLLTFLGYAIGFAISYAILRTSDTGWAHMRRVVLAGFLTGLAMTLLVVTLNWFVFAILPERNELPAFAGTILLISLIIMAVIDLFSRHLGSTPEQTTQTVAPILDRLPLDKRGAVVALSVEDHYVRIRTVKGEDMVLMRLADAIREVGDVPGAQVHRSHWASFQFVDRVTRQSERAILHMRVGPDIPVSRANLPKLKKAGLLP